MPQSRTGKAGGGLQVGDGRAPALLEEADKKRSCGLHVDHVRATSATKRAVSGH